MAPSVAERLLERLDQTAAPDGLCSLEAAAQLGVDHQTLVGAVKSLQALGEVIEAEARTATRWELSAEGEEVLRDGSPEVRLFRSLPEEGLPQAEAMKLPGGSLGFSKAMANKWVRLDKGAAGGPRVFRAVPSVQDTVQEHLGQVRAGGALPERERSELKRRKLLLEVTLKSFWIRKGSAFSTAVARPETELTPEMIATGSWRRLPFKPYNFSSLGLPPACGHLHPLLKVRSELRQIFLEMGFTEMPTDNFVESSFWNFDALFQPQQHPARDQHDTFFLLDPAEAPQLPPGYSSKVKKVHSQGGYGSQGYRYEWKVEEAKKNLLRTHTTSASARALFQLARQEKFSPVKYFSIDRVFRNESLDATHLAEFHQVEGLVADRGLTLGHLMGILRQFFTKLGTRGALGRDPRPTWRSPDPRCARRDLPAAFQTRLQPLHRAQHGGVQLPRGAEEVGGGGELGGLPPRAAAAHGAPRERLRHRLGALAGATHHDQIRHQQHPGARGAPRQPADGLRQPRVPPGCVTSPSRGSPHFGEGSPPQIKPGVLRCLCVCWGREPFGECLLSPCGVARRWGSRDPPGTLPGPPRSPRDPRDAPGTSGPFAPFPPLPFRARRLARAGANHPLGSLQVPISSAEV